MVIGGLAVSILGRPRMTRDIDAVLTLPNQLWEQLLTSATRYEIVPRIPDCLRFARESMVFLLKHVPTETPIDLSVGTTDFEQHALSHRQNKRVLRMTIPVPQVEDLVVMKAIARRPVDQADIATLMHRHSQVDKSYIQKWLEEFSAILDDPTIASDFYDRQVLGRKSS